MATQFDNQYFFLNKLADRSRGQPEGAGESATPFLEFRHFLLNRTLKYWVLSKEAWSTIFFFFFFLILWYDSTWDWTAVSETVGEYSDYYNNGPVMF